MVLECLHCFHKKCLERGMEQQQSGGRNESVVDRAVTPRPSSVSTERIETLCIRKKGSTPTPLS